MTARQVLQKAATLHNSVIQCQWDSIQCQKLGSTLSFRNHRDFWKEVMKIRCSTHAQGASGSQSVDGLTNEADIANHFVSSLSSILNSCW